MQLNVQRLGRVGYQQALDLQLKLVEQRRSEQIPDTLLLLEHPPVITMGRSALDSDILAPADELERAGATLHRISRGGETTYHGPGQLVGYIIANLYEHQRRLKRFIGNLEQVFIDLLAERYSVSAGRDEHHRGVWVRDEKIAAIGIAVNRGITMHGFAFNVHTDLSHFGWIVACGITDRGQTSLERLTGRTVSLSEAGSAVVEAFGRVFGYDSVLDSATDSFRKTVGMSN
ncbi:MAG: lipoyl(octanoyl) transferase LipB [Spirochaetaceae bacterium]|nr:MAG: lipoyl(octanoyl) transferase LipB [Spirochaetaceae bacterium]